MTALFLMMSFVLFSQSTIPVKVTTLKEIKKDLDKCRLLKTAFDLKTANFDSITNINITLFNDLEKAQQERLRLQQSLQDLHTELNNVEKKKKQIWIVPGLLGVVGGIVLGVSL